MSFSDALTELSQLSVVGVRHNFGIDSLPKMVTRALLPSLLVLPFAPIPDRLFREQGEGFVLSAFSNGTQRVNYAVNHLLLTTPHASQLGIQVPLPPLIDLVDAYFSALSADPLLGNTLAEPTRVRLHLGVHTWEGQPFYGCAFYHEWALDIP